MHPTPLARFVHLPVAPSLRQFELERVARQGRLNLQAARAMAEELCGHARRLVPATTIATSFLRQSSTHHQPAFVPPPTGFGRPIRRPF
jgi:hypothetical protein